MQNKALCVEGKMIKPRQICGNGGGGCPATACMSDHGFTSKSLFALHFCCDHDRGRTSALRTLEPEVKRAHGQFGEQPSQSTRKRFS
jgi:hypothetical protein